MRRISSMDRNTLFTHGYISALVSSLPYLFSLSSSRSASLPRSGHVWRRSIFPPRSFCTSSVRVCIFSSVWTHLSDIRTSSHPTRIPSAPPLRHPPLHRVSACSLERNSSPFRVFREVVTARCFSCGYVDVPDLDGLVVFHGVVAHHFP